MEIFWKFNLGNIFTGNIIDFYIIYNHNKKLKTIVIFIL